MHEHVIHGMSIEMFIFINICVVVLLVLFFLLINNSIPIQSTSSSKQDNINEKKTKYYKILNDEALEYYDLYFYWKPLQSWVSCEFYILNGKVKYIWFNAKNKKGSGSIEFGEKSYLKKIFKIWIDEYSKNGNLSVRNFIGVIPSEYLKFITSDVYVKEFYMNGACIKQEFSYFEKIHGHSGESSNSNYSNSGNNTSNSKKLIVEAFKYFGFTKVVDFDEVKKQYKKMALKYHPDMAGGSEEKMIIVNQQFELIKQYYGK